jgi:hypothetical protein
LITGGNKIYNASGPEAQKNITGPLAMKYLFATFRPVVRNTYGGISLSEVNGQIIFNALNGAVALKRVGGSIHEDNNSMGGLHEPAGDRWVVKLGRTHDECGVNMSDRKNYSAHLQTNCQWKHYR